MKVGIAITSSFCTLSKVLKVIQDLKSKGYDLYPIVSKNIIDYDTRFGKSEDIINKIKELTGKEIVSDIVNAEKFGPANKMDVMLVLPATGNFLSKMANGITDNAVNLAVKATLRNQSPVVLAISTNDGLGLNGQNIMKLMNTKGVFVVPFGQDDYKSKPNSLVAKFDLVIPTIESALEGKQLQPVLQ